jgi:hypothetical protein
MWHILPHGLEPIFSRKTPLDMDLNAFSAKQIDVGWEPKAASSRSTNVIPGQT